MIKIVYVFPWCEEKNKPCENCKESIKCKNRKRKEDLKKEE